MNEAERRQPLQQAYPTLRDERLMDEIQRVGVPVQLRAGDTICNHGQHCTHLALILRGRARVYELAGSGREITLYRVVAGECCILTVSCIMSEQSFPAIASCEEDLEVLLIPAARVDDFMVRFPVWRRFIWRLLADRLSGVLLLLEEVTFRRLDERLMRYLLERLQAGRTDELRLTHQAIADDLGSSREVVSRLLKDMQQRGILTLSRGQLRVDRSRLLRELDLCD
jgi:CRP/FNR family transcriptional regulator